MEYIVCYDIVEDKIREEVAKICQNRGFIRIQYSVYFGNVSKNIFEMLMMEIKDTIKNQNAVILTVSLCETCQKKKTVIETIEPKKEKKEKKKTKKEETREKKQTTSKKEAGEEEEEEEEEEEKEEIEKQQEETKKRETKIKKRRSGKMTKERMKEIEKKGVIIL